MSINCSTEGASIVYKVGKSNEKANWILYSGSFQVTRNDTLYAKAIRYGYKPSGEKVYLPDL